MGKQALTSHKVMLATHNAGKVAELSKLLEPHGVLVEMSSSKEGPRELTLEEGGTFHGNAALKAEHLCAETGQWAIADDSGLCVDALGGLPGVDTAFYGGWEKLLENMNPVKDTGQRNASFRCVIALARPQMETLFFEGACEGVISFEGRGNGGFAYDPVFIPTGKLLTFAEMESAEKAALSHRGKAIAKLVAWWREHA